MQQAGKAVHCGTVAAGRYSSELSTLAQHYTVAQPTTYHYHLPVEINAVSVPVGLNSAYELPER